MLEFYISIDTEKNKLMDMFCVADLGLSLEQRAKQYHFPLELAKEMYEYPRHHWDKKLEDFLNRSYQENRLKIVEALAFFQNYWRPNEQKYFPLINNFFGEEIPKYRVLLAHFLDAISNWTETDIVVNAYSYLTPNPMYHVYSLLYEIILSQVFIRTRKIKSCKKLSDTRLWMIAELIAFSFLATTFSEFSKVTKTGYPQIDIYAPKFKEYMKTHPTFHDILEQIDEEDFLKA